MSAPLRRCHRVCVDCNRGPLRRANAIRRACLAVGDGAGTRTRHRPSRWEKGFQKSPTCVRFSRTGASMRHRESTARAAAGRAFQRGSTLGSTLPDEDRPMALIRIRDASGREWRYPLSAETVCTIGRAPDGNGIVLNDPQVSRHHAHITYQDGFVLVDGRVNEEGQVNRSANGVFVNGTQRFDHRLKDGDRISIGASSLSFDQADSGPGPVDYDDDPLGHTQVLLSPDELVQSALQPKPIPSSPDDELGALRRRS